MEFDWDDAKHASNIGKHGVDFLDVLIGFYDPLLLIRADDRHDYGEIGYNMLAKVHGRVHHVTFTVRGPVVWLISARKANNREQRRYAQG